MCMKTEVYSWRVSTELKTGLQREARRRKTSIGALLDEAARDLLKRDGADSNFEAEQIRLHKAASKYIGTISGDNPHRSEIVRELVRERLRQRRDR